MYKLVTAVHDICTVGQSREKPADAVRSLYVLSPRLSRFVPNSQKPLSSYCSPRTRIVLYLLQCDVSHPDEQIIFHINYYAVGVLDPTTTRFAGFTRITRRRKGKTLSFVIYYYSVIQAFLVKFIIRLYSIHQCLVSLMSIYNI